MTLIDFLKCTYKPGYELNKFLESIKNGIVEKLDLLEPGNQDYGSQELLKLVSGRRISNQSEIERKLGSLIIKKHASLQLEIPLNLFFGSSSGKSDSENSLGEFANQKNIKEMTASLDWSKTTSEVNQIEHTAIYCSWSKKLYLQNTDYSHRIGAIYGAMKKDPTLEFNIRCALDWETLNLPVWNRNPNDEIFICRGSTDYSLEYFKHQRKIVMFPIYEGLGMRETIFSVSKLEDIEEKYFDICNDFLITLHKSKKICLLSQLKDRLDRPIESTFEEWFKTARF